ncbi:MAG TPA: O-antigen ligase family protein [Gaiellaceae bacterium]|nr:O-antigen ligase family protein [Gaiellaceae bacterium]
MTLRSLTSFFFLATIFCCTYEKVHWDVAGSVSLADLLALCFVASYAALTRPRFPHTTVILLGFFAAFVLVDLVGFYNLETHDALTQFVKGLVKFLIHFAFLAAGVAWLWRRGQGYYWRALGFLCGGMAVNAAYGVVQLLVARGGGNLDAQVLSPITGGASQINIYGAVEGGKVYRPNALTGDPNHLGIMLVVPLLVLTPLYLRLERGHRLRWRLGLLLAFLLVVEVATLSRSGLVGLGVGALVLGLPYRGHLRSRAFLVPLAAALAVLGAVVVTRLHYFEVVIRSRINTSGGSQSAHFQVYDFVPQIVHSHPLFGLGLNNFSIYYELVTGKTNWGPHSFYVSLIVETGLVGTTLFAVFLVWVFARLRRARRLGRALTLLRDPLAARVRPLAWGMTAALAGTMAANAFYLTMQFYYFYAFLALALAVPLVFSGQAAAGHANRM